MAKKVLIIDDDRNIVTYLSAALSEHGYDPVSAYDGKEGLEKIEQGKPDLIVLDVMMPGKSGFVLIKQLKRDDRYKDIPVLMLTGVSGVLDEWREHKDEVLERPYDPLREALEKKIGEMSREGQLSPEMFVDKPIDAGSFIAKVQQMIAS